MLADTMIWLSKMNSDQYLYWKI